MRRAFAIAAIFWLVVAGLRATPALAGGANKKLVPGEAIVVPAAGITIDTIAAEYGATVADQVNGTYLLRLPSAAGTPAIIKAMRTDPNVGAASGNLYVASPASKRGRHSTQTFPFDEISNPTLDRSGYDTQNFDHALHLDQMAGVRRGAGAVVAVIDTGVDLTHPDLAGHFTTATDGSLIGLDLIDGGLPTDEIQVGKDTSAFGHGTFISGLILKVAPEARIMPIRAMGPDGVATSFDIARAIQFAVENGADVINMSFGAPDKIDGIEHELSGARDHAVLLAAAGNDFTDQQKNYPADESFVLAVAAVDDNGVKAAFSNYGSLIDLCAPGVKLVSTYPGGRYGVWSGTSFATPLAAGTAAILAGKQKSSGNFDPDCVSNILRSTGGPVDAMPQNRDFRGKMGVLVDAIAAFNNPGCGEVYSYVDLQPTDPKDRKSRGEAERSFSSNSQEFEVKVQGLRGNTEYALRVTDTDATVYTEMFRTEHDGVAELKYEKHVGTGDSGDLPADLDPVTRIDKIEILLASSPVLSGTFATDDGGGGGGDDGGGDDGGGGGGGDDGGGDGGGGGDDGGGDDGGGGGGGGGGVEMSERVDLTAVGSDADASGRAEWKVEGMHQRFDVECEDLNASTSYELWVDGSMIGMIVTDEDGKGSISFDSQPGGGTLPIPPQIDPVSGISMVEVHLAGEVILSGTY